MSKAVPNTTNFNINRFSPIFQRYLINRLQDKDWSGRYLASIAGCDEGQISHIRRLGHIPRRDLVAAIGRALGDEDCCLLAAGYLPRPGYSVICPPKKGKKK